MSHFSVLVITPTRPTDDELAAALQPFHEFECTGIDDQYVVDVDRTEEALAEFAGAKVVRIKGPDGTLHNRFDDQGEWKLEFSRPTEHGCREEFIPPGFERVEIPASDVETAAGWISDYYGWPIAGKSPGENFKYGRIEIDADGKVLKCIDRTNPNKQWDWWVLGGRWSGHLKMKEGALAVSGRKGIMGSCSNDGPGYGDQATLAEIDLEGMREAARAENLDLWDKVHAAAGDLQRPVSWEAAREGAASIDAAREEYWAQPALVALKAAFPNSWGLESQLTALGMTRDEFGQFGADGAISTFAVLKDGEWIERGSMGWFGMAHGEMDKAEWSAKFNAMLDDLPPEACLSVVDCHI